MLPLTPPSSSSTRISTIPLLPTLKSSPRHPTASCKLIHNSTSFSGARGTFQLVLWLTTFFCRRSFNVKGKAAHDGPTSGSVSTTISKKNLRISHVNGRGKIEGKYSDKATGMMTSSLSLSFSSSTIPALTLPSFSFLRRLDPHSNMDHIQQPRHQARA